MAPDRGVLAAHLRSTYERVWGGRRQPRALANTGPYGPPDFVGIGVQKAGTSWWYSLITAHPNVRNNASGRKELHFLTRYWDGSRPGVDVDAYYRHFPVCPGSITGEWTPRYLHNWFGPACLAAVAPDARLLVMVRDPVERYCSALTMVASERLMLPDDVSEAFTRGCYASQLRRLRDWFPASQVLVLQYERCAAEPATQLRRTYEFLGLDNPEFTPNGLSNPVNNTVAPKITLDPSWLDSLRRAYECEVREMLIEYPDIDGALWPNFAPL